MDWKVLLEMSLTLALGTRQQVMVRKDLGGGCQTSFWRYLTQVRFLMLLKYEEAANFPHRRETPRLEDSGHLEAKISTYSPKCSCSRAPLFLHKDSGFHLEGL